MRQWTTLMDGIEKLQLQEVSEPVDLTDDEVLVKISCVSLNNRDVKRMAPRPSPILLRLR